MFGYREMREELSMDATIRLKQHQIVILNKKRSSMHVFRAGVCYSSQWFGQLCWESPMHSRCLNCGEHDHWRTSALVSLIP